MRNADKHDKNLDVIHDSLAEAWFRRNLLTRFVRWIVGALVVFIATTAFVQGTAREQCGQSRAFLESYVTTLENSRDGRIADSKHADDRYERAADLRVAGEHKRQIAAIKGLLEQSCDDRYPLLPLGVR